MSDAFKCEICGNFYLRAERGANLSAHPRIKDRVVDVSLTVRMAGDICASDICRSCATTAFGRALKSLEKKS